MKKKIKEIVKEESPSELGMKISGNDFIIIKESKPKPIILESKPKLTISSLSRINNIKIEIDADMLNLIIPGSTIQAFFFTIDTKIRYLVQKEDSALDAINKLREGIFAIKNCKTLPKHISINSSFGFAQDQLTVRLNRCISSATGDLDAYIQVY